MKKSLCIKDLYTFDKLYLKKGEKYNYDCIVIYSEIYYLIKVNNTIQDYIHEHTITLSNQQFNKYMEDINPKIRKINFLDKIYEHRNNNK